MYIDTLTTSSTHISDPIVLWTIIIALATIANVFVSTLMWVITNKYVRITRDIYESSQRPYIGVSKYELTDNPATNLLSYHIKMENFGNVPAKNMHTNIKIFINGDEHPIPAGPVEASTLFPKVFDSLTGIIRVPEQRLPILNGLSRLELELSIDYEGIVTAKYSTKERAQYNAQASGFVVIKGSWS